MLDIYTLQKSGFFKQINLNPKDIVFDEGNIDKNIYIILAGELIVEKYTQIKSKETKYLATLKKFDVFGEAGLNSDKPKEVKIRAKSKVVLLSIDAKEGLDNFSKKYPKEGLNLLKYIIYLSNKRLLEANSLITATYQVSKEIIELDKINNKKIFDLIDKLKNIINVNYIMYFENNPIIKNFIKLKYDTRYKGKLQDKLIEITDNKLNLLKLKIDYNYYYNQKISIGENNIGFLVFFKEKNDFNENDKKILTSLTTSIAGLIKQKQLLEEERDKEYMS